MDDLKCKTWWELFEPSTSEWRNYPLFRMIYKIVQNDSLTVLQWLDSDVANNLDLTFLTEYSGSKHPSLAVERLYQMNNENIKDTMNMVSITIIQKFADKWDRLYSATTMNYRPLENYDIEETETPDITKEKTIATNVTTEIKDDVTETAINGFNSTNPVPQGKTTRNGSSTVSGNANDNIETETETGTRGLTRHGNIGVTTSQQMLQSEIDLRNKYNFYNNVMDDVDSIISLLVY